MSEESAHKAALSDRHINRGEAKTLEMGTMTNDEKRPTSTPTMVRSVCLIAACSAAMIMNTANTTSMSIALPSIGKDLNIPEQRLQWPVSAYSLSSGCLLLLFGRLADLYGRKKVFIMGSVFLTVFSLGLCFANDEVTVDILRGFQGIGTAATVPSAIGILAHAFPPSNMRTIAFSTFSAGAPTGATLGLVLGGILTQESKQTWRATFYLTTGLSAACLILGLLSIDADLPSTETDRRTDWLGAVLVTAGLVLVVFVLSDGGIVGWSTSYIVALLVIGIILLALFVSWERYLEQVQFNPHATYSKWMPPPLMKPSIWSRANGRFAAMMTIGFLNWSTFLSWLFWVLLYYQDYLQLSPIHTMLRLLPMQFSGILCNLVATFVMGRISLVNIVVFGTIFTSSAGLLFALINTSSTYWAFGFPAAVISVFGADFVFAAGTMFVAKVALPHEQSLAGALFQTMTQIGTSFGLAISTIVFDKIVSRDSRHAIKASDMTAPRAAQLSGYRAAQWTVVGFGFCSALLAAIFLRGVGVVGHSNKDQHETEDKEDKRMQQDVVERNSEKHLSESP